MNKTVSSVGHSTPSHHKTTKYDSFLFFWMNIYMHEVICCMMRECRFCRTDWSKMNQTTVSLILCSGISTKMKHIIFCRIAQWEIRWFFHGLAECIRLWNSACVVLQSEVDILNTSTARHMKNQRRNWDRKRGRENVNFSLPCFSTVLFPFFAVIYVLYWHSEEIPANGKTFRTRWIESKLHGQQRTNKEAFNSFTGRYIVAHQLEHSERCERGMEIDTRHSTNLFWPNVMFYVRAAEV